MINEFDLLKLSAKVDAHQVLLETFYAALFNANPDIFRNLETAISERLKVVSRTRYGENALIADAEIKHQIDAILHSVKAQSQQR